MTRLSYFHGEIWKIVPKLPSITHLNCFSLYHWPPIVSIRCQRSPNASVGRNFGMLHINFFFTIHQRSYNTFLSFFFFFFPSLWLLSCFFLLLLPCRSALSILFGDSAPKGTYLAFRLSGTSCF